MGVEIEQTAFEQFGLPLGDALLSSVVVYLIIRVTVGLAYLKSQGKPHSLSAFLWLVGAHLVSFQVLKSQLFYLVLALPACFFVAFKLKSGIPTAISEMDEPDNEHSQPANQVPAASDDENI